MYKTIIKLGLALIIAIMGVGCKNKKDEVRNAGGLNPVSQFGINGKATILQVERPGNLECICLWSSFQNYGRFDLTDVQSGTLKLRTGVTGPVISYDSFLADRSEFNYDKILLGWLNESSVTNLDITSTPVAVQPDPEDPLVTVKLFDLEAGVDFQLQNWATMVNPENLLFSIWAQSTVNGVTEYVELQRCPRFPINLNNTFSITFLKSSFSGLSLQEKQNLASVDLNPLPDQFNIDLAASTDTRFETLLSLNSKEVYDYALKDKTTIPTTENNELKYVQYCKWNLSRYLSDVLLSYSLSGRTRKYPVAQPSLDNNLVLYTNINETLDALEVIGGDADNIVYTLPVVVPAVVFLLKAVVSDKPPLDAYLQKLIGSSDYSAGEFTQLILDYTDYLLYAGLISLFDPAFRTRYFNNFDAILVEMATLLDLIGDTFNNNITIRFYAVASLYDFMKTGDRGYLSKFETYYQARVGSDGEYGEGYDYNTYVNWIVHPVLYLARQEVYTMGPKIGQNWLSASSPVVQLSIQNAECILGAADWWGEVPALDDGFYVTPLLAPMAVIADDRKFIHYTNRAEDFVTKGMPEQDDVARGYVIGIPDNCLRLITYPFNKTITNNTPFDPPDNVSVSGNMVKMRVTNTKPGYTERISLSLIAEDNPEHGKTHDQIDHGEIQLARYVNRAGVENVSHMIIDPGYPGFDEDKRHIEEYQFTNQNSLYMYDMDITTLDDALNPAYTVVPVTGEHSIEFLEPFNPKPLGGMSGYKYFSRNDITDLVKGKLFDTWTLSYISSRFADYSLKSDAGGKSEVVQQFRNGVKTKITYEYRYPSFIQQEDLMYNVYIQLKTDCKGYRDVYNLGNSFYVVDRFPSSDHPTISNLDFGTSWNLPDNTTQVAGWPGCYRGVRPETGTAQTRIQLTCRGYTSTPLLENKQYIIHRELGERLKDPVTYPTASRYDLKQAVFENDASTSDFMVTELNVIDGTETFRVKTADSYTIVSGRRVWTRRYTDGSSDIVIVNPAKTSYTYIGITSDAYMQIVNSNGGGGGVSRLFDCTTTVTVTAPNTITYQSGGQCDVTL